MLQRFFVQYGQDQKPSPDFDGKYEECDGNNHRLQSNYLVHRYVDSLMNSGLYHAEGGTETYDEWLRRGPYYQFRWPKDATDRSTRASVTFQFTRPFTEGPHHVLMFSQWRAAFKIKHDRGRIQILSLEDS